MDQCYWGQCFNRGLETISCIPYECTIESKLRSFQYHVINRSLVTNKVLNKWRIRSSDKCTFCKAEVENIEYLLLDCEFVKNYGMISQDMLITVVKDKFKWKWTEKSDMWRNNSHTTMNQLTICFLLLKNTFTTADV